MYMYNGMYNVMYTCFTTQYQTALHCASKKGHHETVQLLLEKGADPNAQDMVSTANTETLHVHVQWNIQCQYTCSITQDQKTTLHYAIDRGDHETVQLLLEKGADPNAQDWVSTANTETLHVHV